MLDRILQVLQSPSKKLVFLHHNADLDALGSALALYYSFPNISIGAPDNVSRVAKGLKSTLNIDVITAPRVEQYEKVIVIDTPALSKLGLDTQQLGDNLIVIDHHTTSDTITVPLYYCDPQRKSCAEIIHRLLKLGGIKIGRETAIALLSGIIADTAHFRHADISTLKTTIEIMEESGIDLDHAANIFAAEPEDMSEKIAVLKGMQRLKFERVGTWLIIGSTVSSHEATVCNALLAAGGDVAFVAAQREDGARASGRARPHAVRFGFNIGALFQDIGRELGGEGGGHPGAGGVSFNGDAEALLNICMEKTVKWVGERQRETAAHGR